jgi:hypothetical protein
MAQSVKKCSSVIGESGVSLQTHVMLFEAKESSGGVINIGL